MLAAAPLMRIMPGLVETFRLLRGAVVAVQAAGGLSALASNLMVAAKGAGGLGLALKTSVLPSLAAIAPVAGVAAAALVALYLVWRDVQMAMEAGKETVAAAEGGKAIAAKIGKGAEFEAARPTIGERIGGMFLGGGATGKTLAQQRMSIAQAERAGTPEEVAHARARLGPPGKIIVEHRIKQDDTQELSPGMKRQVDGIMQELNRQVGVGAG